MIIVTGAEAIFSTLPGLDALRTRSLPSGDVTKVIRIGQPFDAEGAILARS